MQDTPFDYDGPPELAGIVTDALQSVDDPEVGLDIVAVGLVYAVSVANGKVDVTMTMTSAACPVADVIVGDVEQALDRALPPELLIQVHLVWEPPWSPQRLSADARETMGW